MVRALIQPLGGMPALGGAGRAGEGGGGFAIGGLSAGSSQRRPLRAGSGLLAAAAMSLTLWSGIIWIAVRVLT